MYRPGIDPQHRTKTAVPPPPPQGMMNYTTQRPLPPPIYGSSYTSSQFSYAARPPPPPMAPQAASFLSNLAVQATSSGFNVAPFVPPLPSDLPPPPPLSPPPSPPPLPAEVFTTSDSSPLLRAETLEKKIPCSESLPAGKESSGAKFRPGFYDDVQRKSLFDSVSSEAACRANRQMDSENNVLQPHHDNDPQGKSLFEHISSEAASQAARQVDSENNVLKSRQYGDWNATYQDTLDDEAGSPMALDMGMDLEDAGQFRDGHSKAIRKQDTCADDSKRAGSIHDGQFYSSASALPCTVDELRNPSFGMGSVCAEGEGIRKERPHTSSSSHSLKAISEGQKSNEFPVTVSGSEEAKVFDVGSNRAGTVTSSSQGSELTVGTGSMASSISEGQCKVGIPVDLSKEPQILRQQEYTTVPSMDEFGRLAQKADLDGEPDESKHDLPIDEFGRVMQKEASGSDSEGTRRTSKRKRSYSSSRSRSRSRSRGAGRDRGRGIIRSSSKSRSRSWSQSSRSRSRSMSSASPARSSRRRRQSFSPSPRRKMRWSRSRSRSPEWRRSYSRTPPREMMRWAMGRGGDREVRGDREYFGRGRRGGRGGALTPCHHFARGRCFRGSSCWYPHVSREVMAQDRGTWRRDTQLERPYLDASREEYSADQHSRGSWRRDSRTDRPADFGGCHQEYTGEREKKELVSNSNASLDDYGGESPFNRAGIPFQQTDLWDPKSADKAKDRQVMAYNKALELVGIPHVPDERIMSEEPVIRDEAQAHESHDDRMPSSKEIMSDGDLTMSEAPAESASMDSGNSCSQRPALVVATHLKKSPTMTVDNIIETHMNDRKEEPNATQHSDIMDQDLKTLENFMLEKGSSAEGTDRKDGSEQYAVEVHCPEVEVDCPEDPDLQKASGLEESDARRETCFFNSSSVEGDMDTVKAPSKDDETYSGKNQEVFVSEELEPRTDVDADGRSHEDLAASKLKPVTDLDALEKIPIDLEDASEQAKPDGCKQSEAHVDLKKVVNVEKCLKSQVVEAREQMDVSRISDSSDEGRDHALFEGDLPVTATKADSAETNILQVTPASSLAYTPQSLQNTSSGNQGAGILRTPSDVQPYGRAVRHVPRPTVGSPIPPQGQFQVPAHQLFPAQSYLSSPVQYPSGARDMSQNAQNAAYRLPAVRSVASSQTFDQSARTSTQFSSGNPGFPGVGGWGQANFQAPAPADPLSVNQVHRLPSYTSPSMPNLGIPTSGMPLYRATNQADKYSLHHGVPYSTDQAAHQVSNPNDYFPQLQRPPISGGLGQSNSGGYVSGYSGGFGPPSVGRPYSQHHLSSNSGVPFSQPQITPVISGSFPPHQPSQNHGPVFSSQPTSQNYMPITQPAYGSNFASHPSSQNLSVSTPQPEYANPASISSAQVQTAVPQQGQHGFATNATYLLEQSQPLVPFGVVTGHQGMQASVVNMGFSSNAAGSNSLPSQVTGSWNLQDSQKAAIAAPGQPSAYSYPLTAVPPLSGLVQVPQSTSNQYDPLSDVTSLGVGGPPKVVSVAALSDGRTAGLEKTNAENPARRLDSAELDAKTTTEDVGVVENLSPENWSPVPTGDDADGGKGQTLSKKSSRGLKMLRTAIADHVKEVLKPTWKEGYMSKEAFKTIAKKAVEKVVANLPSHHIPKSQEKVDQFMKSSRPKISKLVQGYVDKYLKL